MASPLLTTTPMAAATFSPTWEEASCHLCGPTATAWPLELNGAPLTVGQFGFEVHPVICQCGLVYLNPRWTATTYGDYYSRHYDELYRLETKPDYGKAGVRRHMAEVWERTQRHMRPPDRIRSILDAGCGSGYGLAYLKEELPASAIFGIEASPDCQRTLQEEVGGELLDNDVDGPWVEQHRGHFDLIVMRHVVEHLLTPIETLGRLRTALSPQGAIYIAVPDMLHPRTVLRDYDKWWEYWFRAVHPYYYCRQTLAATLALADLHPLAWGEENAEVWCLAGPRPSSPPAPSECGATLRTRVQDLMIRLSPGQNGIGRA